MISDVYVYFLRFISWSVDGNFVSTVRRFCNSLHLFRLPVCRVKITSFHRVDRHSTINIFVSY